MSKSPNFYKDRVCLNVLANSVENATDCYEAAEGYVILGVLSKNFPNDETAIEEMKKYQEVTDNALSVGLGAGDPNQSHMVSRISGILKPAHVNQVFTGVGVSRAMVGENETAINGLVSPTGRVGYVKISTGPLSANTEAAIVPIKTAIEMLKDMGGSSIKYFPMKGLTYIEEYKAVAQACAEMDFWLEPTGGIDLDNFEEILSIALNAGVPKVIPHIYSSVIDEETGDTRPEDVRKLMSIVRDLVR